MPEPAFVHLTGLPDGSGSGIEWMRSAYSTPSDATVSLYRFFEVSVSLAVMLLRRFAFPASGLSGYLALDDSGTRVMMPLHICPVAMMYMRSRLASYHSDDSVSKTLASLARSVKV